MACEYRPTSRSTRTSFRRRRTVQSRQLQGHRAMSAIKRISFAGAFVLSAVSASAQAPAAPPGPPKPLVEPKLVFDREVFAYPAQGRRDPFVPLQGTDAMGPLFEDLSLRTIAWSPNPQKSIVLIHDASKKSYLKRLGDVIGNSRIIGI